MRCLAEYAADQADTQSAAILCNAAALLELSVPALTPEVATLPQASDYEHPTATFT